MRSAASVDFPDPLGPVMAVIWPFRKIRFKLLNTADLAPYLKFTCRRWMLSNDKGEDCADLTSSWTGRSMISKNLSEAILAFWKSWLMATRLLAGPVKNPTMA